MESNGIDHVASDEVGNTPEAKSTPGKNPGKVQIYCRFIKNLIDKSERNLR
jgi:hypothetical protein